MAIRAEGTLPTRFALGHGTDGLLRQLPDARLIAAWNVFDVALEEESQRAIGHPDRDEVRAHRGPPTHHATDTAAASGLTKSNDGRVVRREAAPL